MNYSKVIFERITLMHLPILIYHLLNRREIRFLDNEVSAKNRDWVKKLIRKGRISRIPPIRYAYNGWHGAALDNVDKFYERLFGNSALVNEMIKIYRDETIELAYKRALAQELSEFYYINSYLHDEGSRLGASERILFIPYRYGKYLRLAKKTGAFYYDHPHINVAHNLAVCNSVYVFGNRVRAWVLQSGMLVFCFVKLMTLGKGNGRVAEYEYAVLVRDPDFQFKLKNRAIDFLLDGDEINKDNTIFALSSPAVTKDNRDEMKSKNLNVFDCSSLITLSHGLDKKGMVHILRRALPYAVKSILLGSFEHTIAFDVGTALLGVFIVWSSILHQINVKHLITFNDEGIGHIGRNILLNKTGAKTWYYAHSSAFHYLTLPPNRDIADSRRWNWSFQYYDHYVSWNNEIIEFQKLHPQRIGNYVSIGCIWSQAIVDISEGRIVSELGERVFADFSRHEYKTLAFFDSTYLPNLIIPLEGGVIFYQSILRLLEEFPDILVVVKEKKSEETVLKVYQNFGGTSDIFYEQYKPALDELRRHPRCYLTGRKGDPAEVIAMSDLTITLAFSSCTIEALGAKKRAIFFDPCNKWRGCHYDKIPNLVAHDYEELKYLIRKLLYETSEEEYRDFLNTYVKGKIDPYLDGKAVTRFRQLLAE